jgi:hypothetical protein
VARRWWPRGGASGRGLAAGLLLAVLVAVVAVLQLGGQGSPVGARSTATPAGSQGPSSTAGSTTGPTGAATTAPTPAATPAQPTPPAVTLVPAPLTGLLVTPEAATRHPVAVMIDDHIGARPQSGFNSASIVWQAPAEGGIPRYMLIFQDTLPRSVGPIRSARQYYIEWAAEWDAMYVHFGGSYQALATLRAEGHGQLVWNADGFRWSPAYMWRNLARPAPHNVYSDGTHLLSLAHRLGIDEDQPIKPVWIFAPDNAQARPLGSSLRVDYPYGSVLFRYDPDRNAYLRYIAGSKRPQVDAADGQVVAPANVVLIRMQFGPLTANDTHGRLEASDVGHGDAWVLTGGRTIHAVWRKASVRAPTLLFDLKGRPIVFTPGQTFVEVIRTDYTYAVHPGKLTPEPNREVVFRLTPA